MKKINLHCPINSTGYGIASLNIAKNIYNHFNVSYFPLGNITVDTKEDYDFVYKILKNSELADPLSPTIKIWHQFDLMQRIGRGKYFAMPFFELDTFNPLEKRDLSAPDMLFVSSEWAKSIIEKNNVTTPTSVIPLGVDVSVFDYKKYNKTNPKYTFVNIGKWEIRKGHDFLCDVFKNAFPFENDVELIICASEHSSYSSKEEIIKWKEKYSNDKRIKIIPGVESHQQIAKIIAESDCGIFPSRAEGWNLELLECMAMNKPCIATNFSAHTEFCNQDNCFLIDIETTEPAFDGKAFKNQGNWAKISNNQIDQIIFYKRKAYFDKITTNPNGLKTANKYTWENSAQKISGCIS